MENIESFNIKKSNPAEETAYYETLSPNEPRKLAIKDIVALAGKESDPDFEQQCVILGDNLFQTFSSIDEFYDFLAFDLLIDSTDTAYITGLVLRHRLVPLQREGVAHQLANSFAVGMDTQGSDRGIRTLTLLSYLMPAVEYGEVILKLLKQSSNPDHRDTVKRFALGIIKNIARDPKCEVGAFQLVNGLVPYLGLDELEPIIRDAKIHSQQLACRLIAATSPEQCSPLPPFIIDVLTSALSSNLFGDVLLAITTLESIAKNDKGVPGLIKALVENPNVSSETLMNLVWLQNSKLFLDIMKALPAERLENLVSLVAVLFVPAQDQRNRTLAVRWLIMLSPDLFKRVMESWQHLMQQKGLVEIPSAGKLAKIPNKMIVGWENHFKEVIEELKEGVPSEDMVRKMYHFGWVIIQSPDKRSANRALEMTQWLSVRIPDQYVSFATYCLKRATAKWMTLSPQTLANVNVSCMAMAAGVPAYREKHLKTLMEMAKNHVQIRSLLVQGLSASDFNVVLGKLGKAKLAEITAYLSTSQREVVESPDELTKLGQQIQAFNSVDEAGKELGRSLYEYFSNNSELCNYLIKLPYAFSAGYVLSLALSPQRRNTVVSSLLERLKQIVKPGKNAKETPQSTESLQAIVQLLFVLGDSERMSVDIGQLFGTASEPTRDDLTLAIRKMIEQLAKIVRSSDGSVAAIRDRNLGWTKAYSQWLQKVIPWVNDAQLIQIVESNYVAEPFILASPQQWDSVLLPHLLKSTSTCAQLSGLATLPPCHYRLKQVVDGLLEARSIPLQSLRWLTHKSYRLHQDFAELLWSVVCQKYHTVRGMREFWSNECKEGQGGSWQIENLVFDFPVEILALVVREMLASKGEVTGDQALFMMTAYEVLKDSISPEDQNAYLQYVDRAPNGKELLLRFSLEHEPEEVAIEKFIAALTEPKTRGDALRALLSLKYRVADLEEFVEKLGECPGSAQALSLLKSKDSSQPDLSKQLKLELELDRLGGAPPASHMEWLGRVRKARQLYEELQIAKG